MSMDKKLLAAAKREQEREKAALSDIIGERRREIYEKEPRIRAIDRKLSGTAASILKASLESNEDPELAVARLREQNLTLQKERAELLKAMGLPEDYLLEKPLCDVCGDTGYLKNTICTCMKARYAKLLKEELSAILPVLDENFDKFRLDFYSEKPDARLGISPRQNMMYNLKQCKKYAEEFGKNSPNLLLYGSTGLGKTYLSACVAEVVSAGGASVAYDTAINITTAYETLKFGNGDGTMAAEKIARYERADLLIIDDMGTEMGTAFTVSALYNLINTRLMKGLPMIINTNLLPEVFSEKYSAAVASRLLGEFISLRFFGEDIRLMKKR